MPIKSFKGLIADGATETVPLSTNNGSVGYRIVKLQVVPNAPMAADAEHVIKIYKISQTSVDGVVDFSDNTLLGVATIANETDGKLYPINVNVIFDSEIFNQDIYITHIDMHSDKSCNYYIELEQVKLDLNQNTMATLKDIKNIEQRSQI